MRSRRRLLPALVLTVAAGLAWSACLGSGEERAASDTGDVPTATLPDPLPEALIVGEAPLPSDGTSYVVEPGDSLSSIAQQFGTTVEAIAEANGIEDPTRLEVGQRLVIPGAGGTPEEEVLPATAEPAAERDAGGERTHTVKSGDVAASIADRFGITVEELAEANDTTIDDLRSLSVGDVLVIPAPKRTATPEP